MFLSEGPSARQTLRKLGLAVTVTAALLASVGATGKDGVPAAGAVSLAELPPQAQATAASIRAGGPFVSSKDGLVFGNRERLLPAAAKGYYREYTVKTPGAQDRGARRIVCGGTQPTAPDACYYTDDHYASFRRITQ